MENSIRLQRLHAGTLSDGWRWLGAHPETRDGQQGWFFRLWAPEARGVSVVGDINRWQEGAHPLTRTGALWEGFIPHLQAKDAYQYAVEGCDGVTRFKTDPYAFSCDLRPSPAGKLFDPTGYAWGDGVWRAQERDFDAGPLNIYEVHLGSWRKTAAGEFLNYRTLAQELAAYVKDLGYNAVELMPVTEYPLDDSWGYQCTGYFAPTSRYGTPEDFMWFVDHMHQNGIAVVLDWVPAHFCKDHWGLIELDGSCCYEPQDPQRRENTGWGTRVFDYGRPEVRSFLLSSARFWLEQYHMDGLRVDAVASMLYLDYGRDSGQWTPSAAGGRENPAAIAFLRHLNTMAHSLTPRPLMAAEESSVFPGVTAPVEEGGLGFDLKWNMGWMNDICRYLKTDPWLRPFAHRDITFSLTYAFSERFLLPISHDEVVHGKGSLLGKMPGDEESRLASLRGFYAYMMAHLGKKLTFMGAELGQRGEWDFRRQLDWNGAETEERCALRRFFAAMNGFYRQESALWEEDFSWQGFEWLAPDDNLSGVAAFLRRDRRGNELLCAVNFSANDYDAYRLGTPPRRCYIPAFSTDEPAYGGRGFCDDAPAAVEAVPSHGRAQSVTIRIPAFGAVFLRGEGSLEQKQK